MIHATRTKDLTDDQIEHFCVTFGATIKSNREAFDVIVEHEKELISRIETIWDSVASLEPELANFPSWYAVSRVRSWLNRLRRENYRPAQ